MKKSILNLGMLLLLLLAFTGMRAQTWNTVGNGLINSPQNPQSIECVTANGELYVSYGIYVLNPSVSYNIYVEKWNGLSWTSLPSVNSSNQQVKPLLAVLNGEMYLAAGQGLVKFDGQNWITVLTGDVSALEIINGQLVIGQYNKNMWLYDGTNFTSLPNMPGGFTVRDVEYFAGDIYASGQDSLSSSVIRTLKLNGLSWISAAHHFDTNPLAASPWSPVKMITFNNELYIYDRWDGEFYTVDNDSAYYKGTVPTGIWDATEYNGQIYFFGDTSSLHTFDGTILSQVVGEPDDLYTGVEYNGELYAFSGHNTFNGITYNHVFRTQAGYSLLNGTAYQDANGDCFMNTGEVPVPQLMLALNDSDVYATNVNGGYSFSVSPGMYSFDTVYSTHSIGKNIEVGCPLPTSINIGANQTITQDIGMSNTVATDMQTFITGFAGWRARYGFTEVTRVDVNNTGNATLGSATVNVDVPPSLTVVSTDPLPSSVSGNTYSFDFLNVQPLESRQIDITAVVDTSNNSLGDSLLWSAYLNPVPGEADPADNTDTLEQIVTGAYDPNDKQASAYQILPGTQKIDYQIRFQNTGTDSAVNVTVVDSLDMTLPITHIVINSASHPYSLSVNNNILIWEFNNIMLPDSGADLAGSQGYVRFSAGISPGLNVGDTIDNDAEIYFDYQAPVHTNHAKTAIVTTLSLLEHDSRSALIDVYPNPAQDVLYLQSDKDSKSMTFKLINQTGQTVDELKLEPGEKTEYSVAGLAVGVYILWSDSQSYRVVITR